MTAAGAESVEFEAVGLDRKPIAGGNLFLEAFDIAIFKFDDVPALGADEVIVMAFMGDIIVLSLGPKMASLSQACLAK